MLTSIDRHRLPGDPVQSRASREVKAAGPVDLRVESGVRFLYSVVKDH
jgi:hypothetical protein